MNPKVVVPTRACAELLPIETFQPAFRRNALASAVISSAIAAASVSAVHAQQTGASTTTSSNVTKLQPVQVIGEGYKPEAMASPKFTAPLADTPQTIAVIRKEIIEEQNATTLQEVLRNTPGVTLLLGEGGNSNTMNNIFMRGYDTTGSIFTDGVRDLGGGARNTFNVEQVEVIKGASGSEYGRSEASGSINMSTKVPFIGELAQTRLSLGTADQKRATVDINQTLNERTALRLNGMVQNSGVPGRDHVRNRSIGIAPSLALGLGTSTRLFADALLVRNNNRPDGGVPTLGLPGFKGGAAWSGISPSIEDQGRGGVDPSNYYGHMDDFSKSTQEQLTLRIEHDLSPNATLRNITRVGRNKIDQLVTSPSNVVSDNIPNPFPPPNTIPVPRLNPADWETSRSMQLRWQENKLVTNQTNLRMDFATGSVQHALSSGVEFIAEEQETRGRNGQGVFGVSPVDGANNRTNPWNPNPNDPIIGRDIQFTGQVNRGKTTTMSAYVFDTLTFSPQWQLTGGLRVDRYRTTNRNTTAAGVTTFLKNKDTLLNTKLGVVYKPLDYASGYLAVSTSQRPPGGNNFTLSANANNANNPNMEPSKATNLELGSKWEVFDKRLLLTGAVFQTTVRNYTTQADPVTGEIDQYGKREVKGIELGAVGQITPNWNISAGFARMTTSIKQDNANNTGNGVNWSPKISFSSWTTYRFPFGLTVGGGARYMDKVARSTSSATLNNPDANMVRTPDYWVYDAYLAYSINPAMQLQLNVYNLADKRYFANLNNNGNRYTPGAERSAMLTLTYNYDK